MAKGKAKRKNARVKLPIRHANEIEAALHSVREFCGMRGASEDLMTQIRSCQENIKRAVIDRDRVVGASAVCAEGRSTAPSANTSHETKS